MHSTFGGLEIGKRAIMANRLGMEVSGHNIANAENEDYSRQEVVFSATSPLYPPKLQKPAGAGHIGTGVKVVQIKRIRNMLLDNRIRYELGKLGYWEKSREILTQIEMIYQEPSRLSLRQVWDEFWASLQDLANNPEEFAARAAVRQKALQLISRIKGLFKSLENLRIEVDETIRDKVKIINSYAKQIADLNKRIMKAKAAGDNPNDLEDMRDALVNKLAKLTGATVTWQDKDDSYMVYINSEILVQGRVWRKLKVAPSSDPLKTAKVYWADNGHQVHFEKGEMAALLKLRDEVLKWHIDHLEDFTLTLIDYFNEIHQAGFGLDGSTGIPFFQNPVETNNGIYRIKGTAQINWNSQIGANGRIEINGVGINYTATETYAQLFERINQMDIGVWITQGANGEVIIRATVDKDFKIQTLSDVQGNLFQTLGIISAAIDSNNPATWANITGNYLRTPAYGISENVDVSNYIKNDLSKIAAAAGINGAFSGPGDGENALRLASLKYAPIFGGGKKEALDYLNETIAIVGVKSREAKAEFDHQNQLLADLKSIRESISGVSLDEEMIKLTMFQHAFAAAARFLQVLDSMLDRIINGLKVT